jgi:hypothetical protein
MKTRIAICLFLLLQAFDAAADVECLSASEARSVLVSNRQGPYFSLLQPREMFAKTGQQPPADTIKDQRQWVRATYKNAVRDCTPDETRALKGYVSILESRVAPKYPGLFRLPWRFVKVSDAIEGGLPHTAGSVIVLSESMLQSIAATANSNNWQLGVLGLLMHEQVHVIQRDNIKPFEALYKQQFGFRKVSNIKGYTSWLDAHQIVNPDGEDVLWVWPVPSSDRVIWPLVILNGDSKTPRMPDDFSLIGIELKPGTKGGEVVAGKNGTPSYHPLREEAAYMAKFRGISSLYHPNEISADYISDLAVWDCLLDKSVVPQEKLAAIESLYSGVRPWVRNIVGK